MTDRKQFNIKIKSEKAENWENYLEDNPRYSSMTDLIRQSVEKEISDSNGSPSPTQQAPSKDIAELKEMFNQSQQQLTSLNHTVEDLQTEIEGRGPPDKHIRSEIFAALPVKNVSSPQSPHKIADKIGGPVDHVTVSNVLEEMNEEMGVVKESIGSEPGAVRYYKED
ncbi:hypothetical protein KM295_00295 [Natronomonas sp. F2-12]|uniref:Uncharacterized protein n=1 Tax=Natronomonas aquatica TaxID=2841590 RepID=A0A9R1D6E8_9EURY|nr:hypothetical protein [Natronomonas aquatica]MCQ4331945.1 hypothetical protein [Natronomonas aquatica]